MSFKSFSTGNNTPKTDKPAAPATAEAQKKPAEETVKKS